MMLCHGKWNPADADLGCDDAVNIVAVISQAVRMMLLMLAFVALMAQAIQLMLMMLAVKASRVS